MYYVCTILSFIFFDNFLECVDNNGDNIDERTRLIFVIMLSLFWIVSLPYFIFEKYIGGKNEQ